MIVSAFLSIALVVLLVMLLVLFCSAGYNVFFKKSDYVIETGVMLLVTIILIEMLI